MKKTQDMAEIIDGKRISEEIKTEIATEVKSMLDKGMRAPHLAVVIAGEDGAALSYAESIEKQCKGVGFISSVYHLSSNTPEEEFLSTIEFLNNDDEIDGYIIQMPLPKHISIDKVTAKVAPKRTWTVFIQQTWATCCLAKSAICLPPRMA